MKLCNNLGAHGWELVNVAVTARALQSEFMGFFKMKAPK